MTIAQKSPTHTNSYCHPLVLVSLHDDEFHNIEHVKLVSHKYSDTFSTLETEGDRDILQQ